MKLKKFLCFMDFDKDTLDRDMDECCGAISAFVGHRCRVAKCAADGTYYIEFMADKRTMKKIEKHMKWMLDNDVKYCFLY